MMQEPLRWGGDAQKAMEEARRAKKLVLLFFHSRQCSGCKATIAKTLPDPNVSKLIDRMFVPAMFETGEAASRELMKKYGVEWTPTFIVADDSGNEIYRWVGYLPQADFCAELLFAEGRAAFRSRDWDRADKCFNSVVERFPESDVAPEALYYSGVARYEKTHDASSLAETNKRLQERYPTSSWAKKASVWSK
jgi:thioredoxin-related protein